MVEGRDDMRETKDATGKVEDMDVLQQDNFKHRLYNNNNVKV